MKLTAAGEIFARHVISVLHDEQCLVAELDALKGVRCGHLRVVAADGLSSDFLPRVLGNDAKLLFKGHHRDRACRR